VGQWRRLVKGERVGFVIVAVGPEHFAFDLGEVREIARGCWPSRLPRAPFGCLGALTVRGESMALLDLGVLVGARRPVRGEALEKRLLDAHLVVLGENPPLAVLVDRVLQVSPEGELHTSAAAARVTTSSGEALLLRSASLVGVNRRKLLQGALAREATGA
jgi:chemotaxis signal transduction protein